MLKHSWMIVALMALAGGCTSYVTPGRGAEMQTFAPASSFGVGTDGTIRSSFDKKPLASFPAAVAVARVQGPGYRSRTAQGWGSGKYSVVTTRDVEKPEQIQRLSRLPQLKGIAPINRLLLQGTLDSDLALRQAAAQVQADMLLIYTFDTTFNMENKARPLSVISLGLSPNKEVQVTTTASAVLMDTRNGFIYGLAEATSQESRFTNSWQDDVAMDETRRKTESAAFEKLVGELETTWQGVVTTYVRPASPPAISTGRMNP